MLLWAGRGACEYTCLHVSGCAQDLGTSTFIENHIPCLWEASHSISCVLVSTPSLVSSLESDGLGFSFPGNQHQCFSSGLRKRERRREEFSICPGPSSWGVAWAECTTEDEQKNVAKTTGSHNPVQHWGYSFPLSACLDLTWEWEICFGQERRDRCMVENSERERWNLRNLQKGLKEEGSHKETIQHSIEIPGDYEIHRRLWSTVALTCGSMIFSSSKQHYNHFLKPSSVSLASENGVCVVC